jgi:ribosomal-protein-alanine N-acetyltransferase
MSIPTPPTLETARLRLRPYSDADIAKLVSLIGAREIAANSMRIPFPYSEQDARDFLVRIGNGSETRVAITLLTDGPLHGRLIGGVGLRFEPVHHSAELGYWIGVPYWGNGFATEAARALLDYGFETLNLNRIFASYFRPNTASGRILKKLGMVHEGCQREHIRKWDEFVDLELYGMLRQEWEISRRDHE